MADNINVTPSEATTKVPVATDEISSIHYPIYKPAFGELGSLTLASPTNPFPMSLISPLAAFGEIKTAQLYPQVQRKFVLGTNSKLDRLIQHDGGTVTASNGDRRRGTALYHDRKQCGRVLS